MRKVYFTFLSIFLTVSLFSQEKGDTLSPELRRKLLDNARNFSFGFYIDAYDNYTLGGKKDTSNLVPFYANCPVHEQIRLNVAAIEMYYNNSKVRGKLAIQFGDAPNLLADTRAQFIKNIRQANFGFRISKRIWIDFGYMFNPVGFESAWPVTNTLSTATVGGYFEPGMILGIKFSYKFSEKFNGGFMFGNSYSLAYAKNTHMAGLVFLNYEPTRKLHFMYNNFFGNQALKNAHINNNILYNNFIVTYNPFSPLMLTGQFDIAGQTNSAMEPDTSSTAYMYSGFLQAKYTLSDHFSFAARLETFNDPQGFLSGVYSFDDQKRGLMNNGFTIGVEYKPAVIGYIRLEYRYLHANRNNLVYYSQTSDHLNAFTLTTGIRF